MDREKKDPARPRATSSRFDTEYSFSYKKPSSSGRQPVTYQNSSYEIPSPNSNAIIRVTKPRTPYPPPNTSRNCVRSSTAVSSFHTYDKINKMEQIIKKSSGVSGIGRNGTSSDTIEMHKISARLPESNSSPVSGHLAQMYATNGLRGIGGTPRYDDMCAKIRGDDYTWSKIFKETDVKMKMKEEVTQQQPKESRGKESANRRTGQGDNPPLKSPGPILHKPTVVNKPATYRQANVKIQKGTSNLSKKKVRFCENVTTHLVPYEERGSNEWRKNLMAMNMTYRSVLNNIGFPNLGMGYNNYNRSPARPRPMPLTNYSHLPVNEWRNETVDSMNMTTSENWQSENKGQSDRRVGNVKPKTSFNKTLYNLPNSRRH